MLFSSCVKDLEGGMCIDRVRESSTQLGMMSSRLHLLRKMMPYWSVSMCTHTLTNCLARPKDSWTTRNEHISKTWAFEFTLIIIQRFLTQGSENIKLYTGYAG